jgi:hypothetical protein
MLRDITCRTKVDKLDVKVAVDQNVFVFDVAVDNAERGEVGDGRNNLAEDVTGLVFSEAFEEFDAFKQVARVAALLHGGGRWWGLEVSVGVVVVRWWCW